LIPSLALPPDHAWYGGIGTAMSIDRSTHSLFGVSKAAADLLVQEFGRYFTCRPCASVAAA
jgi:CDP-paratose 2-epimerase